MVPACARHAVDATDPKAVAVAVQDLTKQLSECMAVLPLPRLWKGETLRVDKGLALVSSYIIESQRATLGRFTPGPGVRTMTKMHRWRRCC